MAAVTGEEAHPLTGREVEKHRVLQESLVKDGGGGCCPGSLEALDLG